MALVVVAKSVAVYFTNERTFFLLAITPAKKPF